MYIANVHVIWMYILLYCGFAPARSYSLLEGRTSSRSRISPCKHRCGSLQCFPVQMCTTPSSPVFLAFRVHNLVSIWLHEKQLTGTQMKRQCVPLFLQTQNRPQKMHTQFSQLADVLLIDGSARWLLWFTSPQGPVQSSNDCTVTRVPNIRWPTIWDGIRHLQYDMWCWLPRHFWKIDECDTMWYGLQTIEDQN